MAAVNRRKRTPLVAVKRPSNPPEIVSYCQHDTNDHIRRPDLVARGEMGPDPNGRTVTVEVHKQKGCGYLVCGEGKAIDGFFSGLAEAKSACYGFAQSLLVTSIIWLLTFGILATIFP